MKKEIDADNKDIINEDRAEHEHKRSRKARGFPLLLSIILTFCILGTVVYSVSKKISNEMASSAIQNLSESLDLMKGTIEAILLKEAEFQKLIAQEIALIDDPEEFVRSYHKNQTMVKVSLIRNGESEGVSNTGEVFTEEELDFSFGGDVDELPVSQSYVNYMGTWAYTIKCPVIKDDREIASLYIEYVYDSFDNALPDGFYNGNAMLYLMDSKNERLVLKPKGMGERNAGHLNLDDFCRANQIQEESLLREMDQCVESGRDMLFYHDIQKKNSLIYMWSVNEGTIYLIGYVPIEAIQQEGRTVNQNIYVVVGVMLIAFFLCCSVYYFNRRQQDKAAKEREEEREIHNRRLAEALQAAQAASHSKTTFLSNMSHDIRTPMNAVLGFTSLLARDAEDPVKVRDYTKKITASGQHLLSLINDVLDVSKIESGKVVLTVEEFTLNDLVSSVDAIIRPMAKAKKQNFHVEVTGIQHEYLMGDETRINQILINLLSNAVKYTPEGGNIWFRLIGLKQRSSQYEHIRIEVEDDGYGMTPQYLKTIFDAFTRAENSTTNKVQGTGLGMAITKNIVELMGGTIDVRSEVDQGSRFEVELELRIPENRTDAQFWAENGISRILVVNTAPESFADIQALMKGMGVQVDEAGSIQVGAAGSLEEAGRNRRNDLENYGAVLFDWTSRSGMGIPPEADTRDMHPSETEIPGLYSSEAESCNLLQAAQQIRGLFPEQVPILYFADYDAEGIEEALLLPNTGVLAKPFFVSAFQEKVKEMRETQSENAQGEDDESNTLEGLHFLAAEDNEINAEILEEILSIEGADCELVENGQLAVERFDQSEKGEFDAILMDVQMPVMNGYDATRAIRALNREDAGTIPIIAMTANAFAEDEKEALEAGMNVHLAKPIDMDLLKKVIRQYVPAK